MAKATKVHIKLMSRENRSVYAFWTWNKTHVQNYQIRWFYSIGTGVWFLGEDSTSIVKNCTYSVPENATKIKFIVKPVSTRHNVVRTRKNPTTKKKEKYKVEVDWWTAEWSSAVTASTKDLFRDTQEIDTRERKPERPSPPSLDTSSTASGLLTATLDTDDPNATYVIFQLYKGTKLNTEKKAKKNVTRASAAFKGLSSGKYKVRCRTEYIGPISALYKSQITLESPWSEYSDYVTIPASESISHEPERASPPSVSVNRYTITTTIDTEDSNTTYVHIQVYQKTAKGTKLAAEKEAKKGVKRATAVFKDLAPGKYRVRCRGIYKKTGASTNYGPWSEYSDFVTTIPSPPKKITKITTLSTTSVRVHWDKVDLATSYDVECATDTNYFNSSGETKSMSTSVNHAEVTGLETGQTWYFRVRSVNSQGSSSWTKVASAVIGTRPSAPTTWSSTTTVFAGENLFLYWVHNSEDNSLQRKAQIKFKFVSNNGDTITWTKILQNTVNSFDISKKTGAFPYDISNYQSIEWRVCTMGALDSYGPWSTARTITVFTKPTVTFSICKTNNWFWDPFQFDTDSIYSAKGDLIDSISEITRFPFYISATANPASQSAVEFHLSIIANNAYDTTDELGNGVLVNAGDEVYSKYFDAEDNHLITRITPSDVNLDNNMSYTIKIVASMDSGLTAEAEKIVLVSWEDELYDLDAEIGIDDETLSANIKPYCVDEDDELVRDIRLSVYRREPDGGFVEIAKDLINREEVTVVDPHPALDFARYRIVATSMLTGAVSFYDVPGYPVNEPSIVIQWNETWSYFNFYENEELEDPPWSGSMLKLPYNIDESDSYEYDVSLVEYIGRSHPISYYGTQRGQTANWSVEIEKDDKETLYTLRRLAIWPGDVYVRTPSGNGYWAHVSVSFNQNHCEMVIPVTLTVTRVEGGV